MLRKPLLRGKVDAETNYWIRVMRADLTSLLCKAWWHPVDIRRCLSEPFTYMAWAIVGGLGPKKSVFHIQFVTDSWVSLGEV